MAVILVDTSVLLDVVEDDPTWADWSQRQLDAASLRGPVCINPVIYAELFLACKVYLGYRQRSRSAVKRNVLPDFFIGAHAAVRGLPVLTRDVARFRTYFPTVELIMPKR